MKKGFIGLLFLVVVATISTGCLGDAEEKILGQWRYVHEVNPSQHDMYWNFLDGGKVTFYNATTSVADTGNYELYMDGTHRVIKIKNTDITDYTMQMNGEWYIVRLDFDKLVVGVKNQGFQQRDLYR